MFGSAITQMLHSPLDSITSLDYLLRMRMLWFDCTLFAQPRLCNVFFWVENYLVFVVCVQFNGKVMLILCCNFSLESSCGQIVQGKQLYVLVVLVVGNLCNFSCQFLWLWAKDSLPFYGTLDWLWLGPAGSFWLTQVTAGTNLLLCLFNC